MACMNLPWLETRQIEKNIIWFNSVPGHLYRSNCNTNLIYWPVIIINFSSYTSMCDPYLKNHPTTWYLASSCHKTQQPILQTSQKQTALQYLQLSEKKQRLIRLRCSKRCCRDLVAQSCLPTQNDFPSWHKTFSVSNRLSKDRNERNK